MKKFLTAALLLACAGGVASAGVNANGTIFVHDANLVYTTDTLDYCGLGVQPSSCEGADVMINGATDVAQAVFKVYAAFCPPPSAPPRLKGMTFGVSYTDMAISAAGPCVGDLNNGGSELPGPGWPASNTGTAIVFQNTLTSVINECYWFAGYNYYPGVLFSLRAHPDPVLGGKFADDSIPSILDDIAGYGSIGFETSGTTACPDPTACGGQPVYGACCTDTNGDGNPEHCEVLTALDCERAGGFYQGDNTTCDPNPCPPDQERLGACCTDPDGDGYENVCTVTLQADCTGTWTDGGVCDPNPCPQPPNPVKESTWGQIKANYR